MSILKNGTIWSDVSAGRIGISAVTDLKIL